MTREEIVATLRASPEAATSPGLRVMAGIIERGGDPMQTLLWGVQNLAHIASYRPGQLAAFERTTEAHARDAWRAVALTLSPEAEALFTAELERQFREQ